VTIATTDITERSLTTPQVLQMAPGETLPILKEALVKLFLSRRPLTTWVFVAGITYEFILVLDVTRAHDASVDFRRRML
jgi:hypothetical protein